MQETASQSTLGRTPDPVRKPAIARVAGLFGILALLIGAAVVFGLLPRLSRQRQFLAEAKTDEERLPGVNVVAVERAPAKTDLELPGTLVALNEAPIFARVDGYIKSRHADLGQRVGKNQLMMQLDTPELDQQILQAQASISQSQASIKQLEAAIRQARANEHLAEITAGRVRKLTAEGVLSKQDLDDKDAALEARQADVAAAEANLAAGRSALASVEANLQRLRETKSFARLVAPFDGFVTYRNPDVGSLITAGNGNARSEMFRVAQIDPMRIFVNVPQGFVPQVQAAARTRAELTVEQLPGRKFTADVRSVNASLDAASRTMLTVLYAANPKGELLPGMFAQVKFHVGDKVRRLMVPGDTVIARSEGKYVAVTDTAGNVKFRRIEPGRDLGTTLEVLGGVNEGDLVIVNPTDEVRDGARVQLRNLKK
jgi:multidrug efflux pump subunit AcrA (membrane-fusion protein)